MYICAYIERERERNVYEVHYAYIHMLAPPMIYLRWVIRYVIFLDSSCRSYYLGSSGAVHLTCAL